MDPVTRPERLDPALFDPGPVLARRPFQRWKIAHVLVETDYWCLDVDVHAATMPELVQAVTALLNTADFRSIMPAAPREPWERFINGTVLEVQRLEIPKAPWNGKLRFVLVQP